MLFVFVWCSSRESMFLETATVYYYFYSKQRTFLELSWEIKRNHPDQEQGNGPCGVLLSFRVLDWGGTGTGYGFGVGGFLWVCGFWVVGWVGEKCVCIGNLSGLAVEINTSLLHTSVCPSSICVEIPKKKEGKKERRT